MSGDAFLLAGPPNQLSSRTRYRRSRVACRRTWMLNTTTHQPDSGNYGLDPDSPHDEFARYFSIGRTGLYSCLAHKTPC